jgi:hypothetical protein
MLAHGYDSQAGTYGFGLISRFTRQAAGAGLKARTRGLVLGLGVSR